MFEPIKDNLRTKTYIPAINASLSKEGRLSVALNWGNEAIRQRLRDGDRWTDEQVDAILGTLTKQEWDFVQSMWDYIGSYWSEIEAKEKRVYGVAPERVQAAQFFWLWSARGILYVANMMPS